MSSTVRRGTGYNFLSMVSIFPGVFFPNLKNPLLLHPKFYTQQHMNIVGKILSVCLGHWTPIGTYLKGNYVGGTSKTFDQ